ncbi:MAG: ExsB family transcriptional regulator [Candidatus Diapherotrites archaeon]|nr:ExsB family transcriptional regulator [Candidatus Diapherotrites archaeon]
MDYQRFITEKTKMISDAVGGGVAINALSGGVDSSVVTVLGHKAIGDRLKTYFVNSGLMREGEAKQVVDCFAGLGIEVNVLEAQEEFFSALKGLEDPEEKRNAITNSFYANVFSRLVRESGAKTLLQGTILTDVDETVAGIKRQHNVLEQLGIDTEKEYGYKVLEPLIELRKDGVRELGKALGMPEDVFTRIPFPGPALAARVIGEVTPERVGLARKATKIVEEELKDSNAFQYFAVLMSDRATGMREGKRAFGEIIVVRCVESIDARTATPTQLPWEKLKAIEQKITSELPEVVRVLYDLTPKPPSTIEFV